MRRVLVLLFTLLYVVLSFSVATLSQAKRPFTFEDMMALKRVGEPVPSPDGKWVLFSAVDVDLAANKQTPHIRIVPLSSPNSASGATGASPADARVGTGISPDRARAGADASSAQAERSSAAPSSAPEQILIPDQDGD